MPEPPEDLPIKAEDAKRTAVEIICREVAGGMQVEFRVGRFYGAPQHPVWLVFPPQPQDRIGSRPLIAICPHTGCVIFRGNVGE